MSKIRLRRCLGTTGLALLLLSNSGAAENLNLSKAVEKTLANHPSLNVFELRQQSLRAQGQSSQLRPGYSLDVEAENFAGSNSFSGFDNADITVSLSSTLELGGKRQARNALSKAHIASLDTERELQALSLLGEVTRRYVDALAAQQRIELASASAKLAETTLAQVQKRARAGATPKAEVKRAEAALAQATLSLSSEQNAANNAQSSLSALWGEFALNADTLQGNLFQFGQDKSFADLYQQLQSNPALELFTQRSRIKAAELSLSQSESRFDLDWSVGMRRFQGSDDTALVAGISLPLFNGRRNRGSVAAARAEVEQIQLEQDSALLDLRNQLQRAYNNRQQAIHTVEQLQQHIIPALQEAVVETRKAYERGRYSYRDYASANQELVTAQRRVIDAAAAALRYGADIEQLTAQSLAAPTFQD